MDTRDRTQPTRPVIDTAARGARRMRRSFFALVAAGLVTVSGCQPAADAGQQAQDPVTGDPQVSEPQVTGQQAGSGRDLLEDLADQTDIAEQKIMGLARAIPEEDYDWRPGAGVRSVAEVLIHIAADNLFIPVLMGIEAPQASGITTDFATVQAYQSRDIPKEQILTELEASFRFLDDALAQIRGDLNRSFDFAGSSYPVGGMWVQAITHLHEHLGQLIAYARSNDVVPPWSR